MLVLTDYGCISTTIQKKIARAKLSSPLSQVLETYDFGNFEKFELNNLIYHQLHSHMYHVCRN